MNWTPESLARAFHESYARAAGRLYGHDGKPEPWDSLSERARALSVAACADLLGVGVEAPPTPVANATPVPTREEFEAAAEEAESAESEGDRSEGRGDWYTDIQNQINAITAPQVRAAFKTAREPFRK
jgi:hypothetical protein